MIVRSGSTPVSSWAPPARDAEAGDDLVEDEQRAVLRGELAQQLEEAGLGRDEAHVGRIGLGEQRGELVLAPSRRARGVASFQGTITVPRVAASGTPGEEGMPCVARPEPASREQAVDVAVVGAGELHQRLAAGGRAGEPDRAHGRLGARGRHAQHVDRGHALARRARRARPRRPSARRSVVPRAAASSTASTTAGCAWPWISGPQEQT